MRDQGEFSLERKDGSAESLLLDDSDCRFFIEVQLNNASSELYQSGEKSIDSRTNVRYNYLIANLGTESRIQ
jgi:hypothetical protein